MIYEMAVTLNNSIEFTKLYFYSRKEAIELAREYDSVTLYDSNDKVIFQRLSEAELANME